jgi:hypothetical protein
VVLADSEEVDADLLRAHALLDDVADDLAVGLAVAVEVDGHVAEGVEAELHAGGLSRSCHVNIQRIGGGRHSQSGGTFREGLAPAPRAGNPLVTPGVLRSLGA